MTTTAPVAGWYPDPLDSAAHRYWDGMTWTEHTTPAVSPAPAPQPVAAQVAVQTPVQTVQQAPVQHTQYAVPRQAPQIPVQASPLVDPFAVRPRGVRPGPRPSLYAPRPKAGPSLAVKVLIGLAIAFGSVLILSILAAVVIPVFLNERAKGQEGSGPHTAARPTAVVMPATVAGLTRADSTASRQLTQQWMALPLPGVKSVALYNDAAGQPNTAVMLTRIDMSSAEQADFVQEAKTGTATGRLTPFRTVSTGSLGGRMQCAGMTSANATICLFADSKVGGAIDVFGTRSGDAMALRMRSAVEHGV